MPRPPGTAYRINFDGMVFTTRFSGGRGGRNGLESELRALGIAQKNGRPNHPQTPGQGGEIPVRHEALCCIPGLAGRNSKGGSWV